MITVRMPERWFDMPPPIGICVKRTAESVLLMYDHRHQMHGKYQYETSEGLISISIFVINFWRNKYRREKKYDDLVTTVNGDLRTKTVYTRFCT